jgi:hypothetical protein
MFTTQGIIPINVPVPTNKSILINIINNDLIDFKLPNNEKLTLLLDSDLNINQAIDISISADTFSSQNKKLDIFMSSNIGSTDGQTSEVLLLGDIDLPVFYNENTQLPNSAFLWKDFKFTINFNTQIRVDSVDKVLYFFLSENLNIIRNSIKIGDTLYLNNLFISRDGLSITDYSGQYKVISIDQFGQIGMDLSSNDKFVSDFTTNLIIHDPNITPPISLFYNLPFISINKGINIKVVRISNSDVLTERYSIQISDIN